MDEWMDGWTDGRMDGWMDSQIDRQIDKPIVIYIVCIRKTVCHAYIHIHTCLNLLAQVYHICKIHMSTSSQQEWANSDSTQRVNCSSFMSHSIPQQISTLWILTQLFKIAIEIVDITIEHGDFPQFFVCLPEGIIIIPQQISKSRENL